MELLLESLASDALLRLDEQLTDRDAPLAQGVARLIETPTDHATFLRAAPDGHDLASLLDQAARSNVETENAVEQLREAVSAAEALAEGEHSEALLHVHRSERARRLATVQRWIPTIRLGQTARERQELRSRQQKELRSPDPGDPQRVLRREALILAHCARGYLRAHPKARWTEDVCRHAAENARDPETDEPIQELQRHGPSNTRVKRRPLEPHAVRMRLQRYLGIKKRNLLSAQLEPVPPLLALYPGLVDWYNHRSLVILLRAAQDYLREHPSAAADAVYRWVTRNARDPELATRVRRYEAVGDPPCIRHSPCDRAFVEEQIEKGLWFYGKTLHELPTVELDGPPDLIRHPADYRAGWHSDNELRSWLRASLDRHATPAP